MRLFGNMPLCAILSEIGRFQTIGKKFSIEKNLECNEGKVDPIITLFWQQTLGNVEKVTNDGTNESVHNLSFKPSRLQTQKQQT